MYQRARRCFSIDTRTYARDDNERRLLVERNATPCTDDDAIIIIWVVAVT